MENVTDVESVLPESATESVKIDMETAVFIDGLMRVNYEGVKDSLSETERMYFLRHRVKLRVAMIDAGYHEWQDEKLRKAVNGNV